MKTQARLRLRQAGRHCAHKRSDVDWVWRLLPKYVMARAFEMNCYPKHYDTGIQEPCYYTMDYATGVTTWHGPVIIHPNGFVKMQHEFITKRSETP